MLWVHRRERYSGDWNADLQCGNGEHVWLEDRWVRWREAKGCHHSCSTPNGSLFISTPNIVVTRSAKEQLWEGGHSSNSRRHATLSCQESGGRVKHPSARQLTQRCMCKSQCVDLTSYLSGRVVHELRRPQASAAMDTQKQMCNVYRGQWFDGMRHGQVRASRCMRGCQVVFSKKTVDSIIL